MGAVRTDEVSQLPDNFIRCRDIGHTWWDPRRNTIKHTTVDRNHIERSSTCSSCGTSKTQVFTLAGKPVTGPRYDYVDGYLLVKGKRKFTRIDARKLALKAAMNGRHR